MARFVESTGHLTTFWMGHLGYLMKWVGWTGGDANLRRKNAFNEPLLSLLRLGFLFSSFQAYAVFQEQQIVSFKQIEPAQDERNIIPV